MLLAQRPLGILLPDIAQVDALVAVSRARVRLLPHQLHPGAALVQYHVEARQWRHRSACVESLKPSMDAPFHVRARKACQSACFSGLASPFFLLKMSARHGPVRSVCNCWPGRECVTAVLTLGLRKVSWAQTDEERARFSGPGLLVLELAPDDAPDPDAYYAVPAPGGAPGVALAAAADLPNGAERCGRVLFCCRPPGGASSALTDTAEILQL